MFMAYKGWCKTYTCNLQSAVRNSKHLLLNIHIYTLGLGDVVVLLLFLLLFSLLCIYRLALYYK